MTACDYLWLPVFQGESGNVMINENGDRETLYTLWSYSQGSLAYYQYMDIDVAARPNQVSVVVNMQLTFRHFNKQTFDEYYCRSIMEFTALQ